MCSGKCPPLTRLIWVRVKIEHVNLVFISAYGTGSEKSEKKTCILIRIFRPSGLFFFFRARCYFFPYSLLSSYLLLLLCLISFLLSHA